MRSMRSKRAKVVAAAVKVLRSPHATKHEKSVAASALTQYPKKGVVEQRLDPPSACARVLRDQKTSKEGKMSAAMEITRNKKTPPKRG